MNDDSKSTQHGNKTDHDQLTDDQLQAVSGGSIKQEELTEQKLAAKTFEQALQGGV
jgi:bacteriocin-like protein